MMEIVGHAHTRIGSAIEGATVWVWRRERKWFCLRGSGRPKVRKGAMSGNGRGVGMGVGGCVGDRAGTQNGRAAKLSGRLAGSNKNGPVKETDWREH